MTKSRLAYALAAALLLAGGIWYFQNGSDTVNIPIPGGDCNPGYGNCPTGYRCIEKCGPPVASDNDSPPGYYCERADIAENPLPCPICLASNTMIATPNGEVGVRDVRVGMTVWSQDADGSRIQSTVRQVSRAQTPKSHRVIHLIMEDGREAWISPGHPVADGATVRSAERVPYWDDATYDLLPDSATGRYWANDILLESTLMKGGGYE